MKLREFIALPQTWLKNISLLIFLIAINIYLVQLPKHIIPYATTLPKQKDSFQTATKISKMSRHAQAII